MIRLEEERPEKTLVEIGLQRAQKNWEPLQ